MVNTPVSKILIEFWEDDGEFRLEDEWMKTDIRRPFDSTKDCSSGPAASLSI